MAAAAGMALRRKGHLMMTCMLMASALEIRYVRNEADGQVAHMVPAMDIMLAY
jgi:hypothetical protein